MLPHKHAFVSAGIGATALLVSGDALTMAASLAAGVLPDVDHVVDYAYFKRRGAHRLILPLHGYEFAVVGAVVALALGSQIAVFATLSYLVHLLGDQLENRTRRAGYWFLFRAWHRFRLEAISTVPEAAIRGREDDVRRLQYLWLRVVSRTITFFTGRTI